MSKLLNFKYFDQNVCFEIKDDLLDKQILCIWKSPKHFNDGVKNLTDIKKIIGIFAGFKLWLHPDFSHYVLNNDSLSEILQNCPELKPWNL